MNNKGFAITSILYGIMVLFLILLLALLGVLKTEDDNLERSVSKVDDKYNVSYDIILPNETDNSISTTITKTCRYEIRNAIKGSCLVYYLPENAYVGLVGNEIVVKECETCDNTITSDISCVY